MVLLAKPGISPGLSWFDETTAGLCKLKGRELAPDTGDAPTDVLSPNTAHNTKQPCKSKHQSAHLQNLDGGYLYMLKSAVKFLHLNYFGI